ncbi:MAG: ketoacyl-ACP synthase III [Phycisphaerae bacterium]|jgi:3-oxoacyl-[acyl-carrier-protein] synthase-3
MKLDWPIEIAGTGSYLPDRVITNIDLAARLDTSDEWIVQRTGIRARRYAAEQESTLVLATRASQMALERSGLAPSDIDLIIVGTATPEHTLPSTACELQAALGCGWIPAFDVAAACSGFLFGFITAAQYLASGMARNVLVVGAETLSRITDQEDRSVVILMGDGAGAAVLRRAGDERGRLLSARFGADGARARAIWIPAGGAAEPASVRTVNERLHYMRMNGREVYKFAISQMCAEVQGALDEAGITIDQLKLLVPHQSNQRIIEAACQKLGLSIERVMINIDRYGNTSAASVPVALDEAFSAGRLRSGDHVMMVAFGAGLTWASTLLRI